MQDYLHYALLFFSSFFIVFFLGLQSLNVNGGHTKAAAATSLMISFCNYFIIKTVPSQDLGILGFFCYVLGGPIGIVVSMKFHQWLTSKSKK